MSKKRKMNLPISNGQLFVILTLSGDDYIALVWPSTSPFTKGGSSVSPTVSNWEATANTSCTIDNTQYIEDSASPHVRYVLINGPRPIHIRPK